MRIIYLALYQCAFQVSFLMRHLPDHSQRAFLPDETRRVLFFVFGRWCGKYGDALENLDLLDEKVNMGA